ncbi:MAG: 4a-hydroxytetrahydrobiopterin dehydratase [Rubinisphaera brasiliensis]|uniref:4a-hydroxytetrahydrobiopterin dehydratase n=1 Tax=Rubinisphaera brasiliensis TaxID=119 RepID=UPI003918D4B1|nr:4a-hydroxytetrahydrobiopterin dehydratase [bacterium]
MAAQSSEQLVKKRCVPCEGGVEKLDQEAARAQLEELSGWELLQNPDRIKKTWTVRNFMAGMNFFNSVAELAETEGHHPDLHLVGYRNLSIEIWTHAIQGLSENDFILAAKIDNLPVELKA